MNRLTVLIVEDELVNRKILKKILESQYEVLEAENGADAWDMIANKENCISAVLLDIIMPIMNGYQLLSKMQDAHMEDIPVIVTTGATDQEEERKALDLGAWDYVTKPYNAKILSSRLRNAIARSELAAYDKLQYMSEHDELTGLYNRSKLFEETRKMIDSHPTEEFVFIRADIDHFALFNTSFGESEGNRLLKFIAECITNKAKRYSLCTYGRIAADVFVVCRSYLGDSTIIQEEIDHIQKQLATYRQDYRLDISVGACVMDNKSLSIEEYFFRSTVATQQCKNQVETHFAFYDNAAGDKIAEEIAIANEMQTALNERQFVVYLQPKFSVSTESACGAEALVRWKHPRKGLVLPSEFIPVFEKNGFISKLDYFVWEETCQMLSDWLRSGIEPYPVSVNISRISLYNPKLASLMTELVHKYNISPSLLQLEVTESAYMTNPEMMEKTIKNLHDAGFTILMDDFGSSYSSLNTLKQIKMDLLKVDMQFLPVNEETERGEIILSSVIKMANWLGMSVVVEGVENRRQRDFLEGAGCDYIQGFYYSEPIPRNEYEEKYLKDLLTKNSRRKESVEIEIVPQHNMTILVMDDSEIDRAALKAIFQNMYHVHLCESAEDGLIYLRKNSSKVRLILVDNVMPGMSGLDFLRYCREDNILSVIPKIMITTKGTVKDQVEAFGEGAYDYITKPFIKEIVEARINHVMDISRINSIIDSVGQEYRKKSELDVYTNLLNKIAFKNLSNRILESFQDERQALMVLDIDDFKQVNDTYGHLAGDKVISWIADELMSIFRKTDIIGRFGGDEFVVLMTKLPNTNVAKRKSDELIKEIKMNCSKEMDINISVSIGISFSEPGDTIETLFVRADQALYEAKSTGKGRTVIYGDRIPPVTDDDKSIVLVCGRDPKSFPAIALTYGESAAFAYTANFRDFVKLFEQYKNRIRVICVDIAEKIMEDYITLYEFITSHGDLENLSILAICREGKIDQLREALQLQIDDVITLPPQTDVIQRRLSRALMNGDI